MRDRFLGGARSNNLQVLNGNSYAEKKIIKTILTLLLWPGLIFTAAAKDVSLKTEANVMIEMTFRAKQNHTDPFNDV
ncbi:MAG: hypothetical protein M3Y82_08840, partial [Verrucomicrobiota bacterium]|nr:hypothetical protein [Verrucomicrobiota bacterium]